MTMAKHVYSDLPEICPCLWEVAEQSMLARYAVAAYYLAQCQSLHCYRERYISWDDLVCIFAYLDIVDINNVYEAIETLTYHNLIEPFNLNGVAYFTLMRCPYHETAHVSARAKCLQ